MFLKLFFFQLVLSALKEKVRVGMVSKMVVWTMGKGMAQLMVTQRYEFGQDHPIRHLLKETFTNAQGTRYIAPGVRAAYVEEVARHSTDAIYMIVMLFLSCPGITASLDPSTMVVTRIGKQCWPDRVRYYV